VLFGDLKVRRGPELFRVRYQFAVICSIHICRTSTFWTLHSSDSKKGREKIGATNDNSTHKKESSVTQDKNIIDSKHGTSRLRSENKSDTSDAKMENKNNSQNPQILPTKDSVTEKPSSVTEDKTITKVKSSDSDNQPDRQSRSSDSIKRDRALFFKYLNSNRDNIKSEHSVKTLSNDVTQQSTCRHCSMCFIQWNFCL
jgi:hypothetical protein